MGIETKRVPSGPGAMATRCPISRPDPWNPRLVDTGDGEGDGVGVAVGAVLGRPGVPDGTSTEDGGGDPAGVEIGAELVADPQATTNRPTTIDVAASDEWRIG